MAKGFFVSRRPLNQGDPDGKKFGEIFCSEFVNGKYREPERLGPVVNSEDYEGSPFISPDGRFLFYVAPYTNEFGVYWVKADFIGRMKSFSQAK